MVTNRDTLSKAGDWLKNFSTLEKVTLVYNETQDSLVGFQDFISSCGSRISHLQVSSNDGSCQKICMTDMAVLSSEKCLMLDSIAFEHFEVDGSGNVPSDPLNMRYLTSIRLGGVKLNDKAREIIFHILGGCQDLESLQINFAGGSKFANFFFNDFLLDELLRKNPMSFLEEFVVENGCLTLISALKLLSGRPKLKKIGALSKWDVEPSEHLAFLGILLKAKGMNLLHRDMNVLC